MQILGRYIAWFITLRWNRDLLLFESESILFGFMKRQSNKKWVLSKAKSGTDCCPGSQINEVYTLLEKFEHGSWLSSSCDAVWELCFLAASRIPSPATEIESIHCSILRNIIPGRNTGRTCTVVPIGCLQIHFTSLCNFLWLNLLYKLKRLVQEGLATFHIYCSTDCFSYQSEVVQVPKAFYLRVYPK